MKHSKRRIHLLLGEPHRIDILALRAHRSVTDDVLTLDVLPKPGHPSSRKSVRIGESSSIKGPISDDKDLEMNGPCHSTGSLSSERATTALSTNTPSELPCRFFAKQRRFKLLIDLLQKRYVS